MLTFSDLRINITLLWLQTLNEYIFNTVNSQKELVNGIKTMTRHILWTRKTLNYVENSWKVKRAMVRYREMLAYRMEERLYQK